MVLMIEIHSWPSGQSPRPGEGLLQHPEQSGAGSLPVSGTTGSTHSACGDPVIAGRPTRVRGREGGGDYFTVCWRVIISHQEK